MPMPSFAKRIHIDKYGEFDFMFTRVYTRNKEHFMVVVYDGEAKVCQFTMLPVLNYWIIEDACGLPSWMLGVEQEIEKVIKKQRSVVV
jgi:hypothetical protein